MQYSNGDHNNADANATARVQAEKAAAEQRRQAAATAGRGSRRV